MRQLHVDDLRPPCDGVFFPGVSHGDFRKEQRVALGHFLRLAAIENDQVVLAVLGVFFELFRRQCRGPITSTSAIFPALSVPSAISSASLSGVTIITLARPTGVDRGKGPVVGRQIVSYFD